MNFKHNLFLILSCSLLSFNTQAQLSQTWVADNGDGTYKNPVLHADYSDPDAIRVGDDYYMVASSFNCVPALPILHSKDLVNWSLIGYAVDKLPPFDVFNKIQHGNGVWAPCIRYHNNEFYIYYPDPDFGIYVVKAKDPRGPWSEPLLVKEGKGLIDTSPLWDEDGKAYLAFAFAGSRAGVKSVLMVSEMNAEGTKLIGTPVMVFDGHDANPTVEGPKFYKRNGYYYIFAPAGGVAPGWQLAMRSKNIFGPYISKMVMAQGKSVINGPHQGAWVDTQTGEDWFLNFQDKGAYGRILHLQPMKWVNDWPVIGIDSDNDGCGEPVLSFKKPNVGKTYEKATPPENDEFNGPTLGLQWQWHANPEIYWGFPSGNLGFYRLNCIPKPKDFKNLWDIPNLLLQKLPAEEFTATAKLTFNARFNGEETGFVMMGTSYQSITLKREADKLNVSIIRCIAADKGTAPEIVTSESFNGSDIYLRIKVEKGANCTFFYSTDNKKYKQLGEKFTAKEGRWIGAKIGFYTLRDGFINDAGTADIDWIRFED
jgi:beta-xylosidase